MLSLSQLQDNANDLYVAYCGKEHQTIDWNDQHKALCNQVKKARKRLQRDEDELKSTPPNLFFNGNPFETSVGHFWGIPDTRDYMRARFGVVEALLDIYTKQAVQEAHDHVLDMLRLDHSDNMGMRYLMHALFLRLGKDQDTYRFIKWWHLHEDECSSKLEDGSQPYIETADTNAFEPIDNVATDEFPVFNHIVQLTLLKLRMLADLRTIDNSRAVGDKVPQELLDSIQDSLISPLVASDNEVLKSIKTGENLRSHIITIESQTNELFARVDAANEHFWPALLDPEHHLRARPPHHSSGSVGEMQMALKHNYRSWVETPAAIDFIKARKSGIES